MTHPFWNRVAKDDPSACWNWTGALAGGRDGKTYGLFSRSRKEPGRRNVYAHRMAYCLANGLDAGTFPASIKVRHKCDNPRCCNPAHLEPGTQAQNAGDMVDRGRSLRGEKATCVILTEAEVRVIKGRLAQHHQHGHIAADYGVSRAAISQIACGKNWAWVV